MSLRSGAFLLLNYSLRSTAAKLSFHLLSKMSKPETIKRGALIVFEGCDKSGKSTQCSLLVDRLNNSGIRSQLVKFPDRTTTIGLMINNYLQNSCQLDDHVIHLLFSANRWEAMSHMTQLLKNGVTLVVDRYSFSGVAFSSAKPNMDFDWCRQAEKGLLRPDRVIYLTVSSEVASQRGDYGKERYEKDDFQMAVAKRFEELVDDSWIKVHADRSIEELSDEIFSDVLQVVQDVESKELQKLWV